MNSYTIYFTGSNDRIRERIRSLYNEHNGMAGSPMITADLRLEAGFSSVSKNRVARHMRAMGLRCRTVRKFIATTDSKHKEPVAENILNRKFSVSDPNTAWVSDITYVKVGHKWHYLSVFIAPLGFNTPPLGAFYNLYGFAKLFSKAF